jgi:hypothetical protein
MKRHERQLLKALRRGDRSVQIQLIDQNYKDVYRYLLQLAQVREEAEDLTQNAFAKGWTSLEPFQGRASFRTWLLSFAAGASFGFGVGFRISPRISLFAEGSYDIGFSEIEPLRMIPIRIGVRLHSIPGKPRIFL